MANKQDFLKECNDQGVALPDFQAAFCDRCQQKECTRSQAGKSRFEQRTSTWQSRLFDAVPRMDMSDPRFITLSSKRFVEISQDRVPEIGMGAGGWLDPRDLDVQPKSPQDLPSVPLTAEPVLVQPSEPVVAPPVAPVQVSPLPVSNRPFQPRLSNTPNQRGQMLGGRTEPEAPASREVSPPQTKGLPVVRPGARIKMGGGV